MRRGRRRRRLNPARRHLGQEGCGRVRGERLFRGGTSSRRCRRSWRVASLAALAGGLAGPSLGDALLLFDTQRRLRGVAAEAADGERCPARPAAPRRAHGPSSPAASSCTRAARRFSRWTPPPYVSAAAARFDRLRAAREARPADAPPTVAYGVASGTLGDPTIASAADLGERTSSREGEAAAVTEGGRAPGASRRRPLGQAVRLLLPRADVPGTTCYFIEPSSGAYCVLRSRGAPTCRCSTLAAATCEVAVRARVVSRARARKDAACAAAAAHACRRRVGRAAAAHHWTYGYCRSSRAHHSTTTAWRATSAAGVGRRKRAGRLARAAAALQCPVHRYDTCAARIVNATVLDRNTYEAGHAGLHCRIPLCGWLDGRTRKIDSCGGGVRAMRIVLRVPFALVVGVIGLLLSGLLDAPALHQ